MLKRTAAAAIAVLAMAAAVRAEPEASLKIGDPAPALAGGKWVKGDPIEKFEGGKIYVVEFWATWCGPCREAIPHVSELQKKYAKDNVTFIGQNVWEQDQSKVEPFVSSMGDKMDYRVRMDDVKGADPNAGTMATTWMTAAGQNGIPCSFLVNKDGKIAWIGHPMELEEVLKKVIAGTYDPAKAAADEAAFQKVAAELSAAAGSEKYDVALAKLDEIEKLRPQLGDSITVTRFQLQFQKKDYDAAYKTAAAAGDTMTDAGPLSAIAYQIATADGEVKRDLPLAEKLASRSVTLTGRKDFAPLAALARVYFEEGKTDQAVATQKESLELAPDDVKDEMKSSLDKYAKGPTTKPGASN